jgi:hypothetical protein
LALTPERRRHVLHLRVRELRVHRQTHDALGEALAVLERGSYACQVRVCGSAVYGPGIVDERPDSVVLEHATERLALRRFHDVEVVRMPTPGEDAQRPYRPIAGRFVIHRGDRAAAFAPRLDVGELDA